MSREARNNRVLVVDDNPSIHADFEKILGGPSGTCNRELEDMIHDILGASREQPVTPGIEQPCFDLAFASQGQEAFEIVRQARAAGEPFAVAFVDMRMPPGWDGLKTLEHLHAADAEIQTVICSAYSDYRWQDISRRLGRLDRLLILKKPFEPIEALQIADALTTKWSLNRDLADQMRELERSRSRLQGIVDNVTAAISLKDRAGRYLLVNRAFRTVHGLGDRDVLGRSVEELFGAEIAERLAAVEASVWQRTDAVECEEEDPCRPHRTQLTVRFALRDENGDAHALCAVEYDVTEQRRMQDRVNQHRKMEALGRLAGGVAHDFNNLLTTILGCGEMALDPDVTEEDRLRSTELLLRAGREAAELTELLVAYSRKQPAPARPVDVNQAVRNSASILRPTLGEHIDLQVELAPGLPEVVVESGQLGQVVLNLGVNACDAMREHGGRLRIRTALVQEPAAAVVIEVADDGCGIPPELLQEIWEPFFTTKGEQGSGFGLATVHGIVRDLGGEVNVDSEVGRGTRFTVSLPVTPAGVPG